MTDFKREEIYDPTPERAVMSDRAHGIEDSGEVGNLGGFGEPTQENASESFSDGSPVEEVAGSYASDEEAITDINDLDLQSEPMEDVDMDKLEEALAYAPSLKPGSYFSFIFKLDDEKPWQAITMKGKPEAQFNYSAILIKEDGTEGKTLRFQNASTFRSGKMTASRADELLFAVGKLREFKTKTERKKGDILRLLSEASTEQVVFEGQVQWRHYDKATGITTSTAPSKPYKKIDKATGAEVNVIEQAWPRDEHGVLARHPGNEYIARVRPSKASIEAQKEKAA